jgi:hypothetical protein
MLRHTLLLRTLDECNRMQQQMADAAGLAITGLHDSKFLGVGVTASASSGGLQTCRSIAQAVEKLHAAMHLCRGCAKLSGAAQRRVGAGIRAGNASALSAPTALSAVCLTSFLRREE